MTAGDIREIDARQTFSKQSFDTDVRPAGLPVILRGLTAQWPAVKAAQISDAALFDYLKSHDTGRPQNSLIGNPDDAGFFFFSEDLRGQNYTYEKESLSAALDKILSSPKTVRYVQSILAREHCPAVVQENLMPLLDSSVSPRMWIGGQTTVQTHFDLSENIACVVAGTRRVTLFAPDQLPNLYPGPLETAPGGTPVSLARVDNPDFEKHPRFKTALENAHAVNLNSGDAIYIPPGWWHRIQATAEINMLVNYWWTAPGGMAASPYGVMAHAMMSFSDMPPPYRHMWKTMFDYFVFREHGDPMAHVDDPVRGILGGIPADRRDGMIYELLAVLGKEVGLAPPRPPKK